MKPSILLLTASLGLAAIPGASAGMDLCYDNGSLVVHSGQRNSGWDASAITSGLGSYGSNMNPSAPYRLTDDFTVPAGQTWDPTGLRFYGYQTNSGTSYTFTSLVAQIWNDRAGNPGSSVPWGNLTDNILTSSSFSGIYRVTDTAPYTSVAWPIMALDSTLRAAISGPTTLLSTLVLVSSGLLLRRRSEH